MSVLDVFKADAFSMASMLEPIERSETVPRALGNMGLFAETPIGTETVMIESQAGALNLIQTSLRGSPLSSESKEKANVRNLSTTRIAKKVRITASELAFMRAFGTEDQIKLAAQEVNKRLSGPNGLLADVEATFENMRLGAVQGILTDADATEIYNFYTEFDITANAEVGLDLTVNVDGTLRKLIHSSFVRPMRQAAKGASVGEIRAICGANLWDELIANDEVRASYLQQQEASQLRNGYEGEKFKFAGVTWEEYMGTDDGTTVAVSDDEAKIFPGGQSGAFEMAMAPGETFADLGALGQKTYAMVLPDDKRDQYVDLEVYAYPLIFCRRPDLLFSARTGA